MARSSPASLGSSEHKHICIIRAEFHSRGFDDITHLTGTYCPVNQRSRFAWLRVVGRRVDRGILPEDISGHLASPAELRNLSSTDFWSAVFASRQQTLVVVIRRDAGGSQDMLRVLKIHVPVIFNKQGFEVWVLLDKFMEINLLFIVWRDEAGGICGCCHACS
jgi:hypothetical protein